MMSRIKISRASELSVIDIQNLLGTDLVNGLTHQEAAYRLLHNGPNSFGIAVVTPIWIKYIYQFKDPLIMLLLASAAISMFMGQFDDAISISMAIITVVTVAFVQEYRSEKFLETLNNLMPPECQCVRDSQLGKFLAQDLVQGDIVYISIGDRVPADMRLFETISLSIDESSFSGETEPIFKNSDCQLESETTNQNGCPNIAFMGGLVCTGHGKGIVIRTGQDSTFGEICNLMQQEEAPKTPLQKSMDTLGAQLSFYSCFVISIIVVVGWLQGRKILDMFTIGVSLAVAAIPEGLPIIVTVTLAIGVMRMAKRNAIIKKLPVVETLGCVDVICCDKTGTLTKNEMTVTHVITADHHQAELTGIGYSSPGEVNIVHTHCLDDPEDSMKSFRKVIEVGCMCNNAEISFGKLLGSPTEGALLAAAVKFNLDMRDIYVRVEEWPFSSETKIMIVKCHLRVDENYVVYFLKGALEHVLKKCILHYDNDKTLSLSEQEKEVYLQESYLLEQTGLRVLGMAYGTDLDSLVYVGLVGIIDPPREEVKATIQTLQDMNIRVKMLTGDSKETAKAVATRIGLNAQFVSEMSGDAVEVLDMAELSTAAENVGIFYRVSPRHKLKIIKALQAARHVVAMMGDGVNDAVALKTADIGISMGKTGTDVSKEAADMILLDDNLSTVLAAVEEGKSIFFNIKNFVRFQLSTSMAALSLVALAMFLKLPNPLNAIQVLWINIIMDGPPAQSLGLEAVDHDVLKQPPRKVHENIISYTLITGTLFSAIIIICGTLLVFYKELEEDKTSRRSTTMTFTCFVLFDMFNALSCRTYSKSVFQVGLMSNKVFLFAVGGSLISQLLVIYFPPLQTVFQTEALLMSDFVFLIPLTSTVFVFSEVKKFVIRLEEQRKINGHQSLNYPENLYPTAK